MAHQHDIKRLGQCSTAEEYTRPSILYPFQPIISHSNDIFGIRRGCDHHSYGFQHDAAWLNALNQIQFMNLATTKGEPDDER